MHYLFCMKKMLCGTFWLYKDQIYKKVSAHKDFKKYVV